jgi:hypothetical protein
VNKKFIIGEIILSIQITPRFLEDSIKEGVISLKKVPRWKRILKSPLFYKRDFALERKVNNIYLSLKNAFYMTILLMK